MSSKIISYDLGTGGLKASLFSDSGELLGFEFESYPSYNLSSHIQEQAPSDWWGAIVSSTQRLLRTTKVDPNEIVSLAISGHSLGVVPIDKEGNLLVDKTPIWSDKRAHKQSAEFFEKVDYESWYRATGSGFPAECYSIFKIMWYRDNLPEIFSQVDCILGTKDYCNFLFTGRRATDHSYASGSGVYSLLGMNYCEEYISASGIDPKILPEILDSTAVVGTISEEASRQTGLPMGVKIISGGVDNSCMALGAGGYRDGHLYTSLGSSAWIALSSTKPVLNFETKPYVFAHVVRGMYASATCIFSAGTSLSWVLDNLYTDLSGDQKYIDLAKMASESTVGANGLIFNPSLAGGSMLEESANIVGGFVGLNLSHNRCDMMRATLEGIAMNLRIALDELMNESGLQSEMLMVGGGAKSPYWMGLFANIYGLKVLKSSVDQECASLGAAALAAVGAGLWSDFSPIDAQHTIEAVYETDADIKSRYDELLPRFRKLSRYLSEFGDMLNGENI
ncbi:MAG: FGGY family carbohydrate kinase [Rikenellaceae bacterium]